MIEQTTFLVAWSIILNFKIIMAGPINRSDQVAPDMYPKIEPAGTENKENQTQDSMLNRPSQTTQDPQETWLTTSSNLTGITSDFTDGLQSENTTYLENSTTGPSYSIDDAKPKITIQEIIPERKEIPVTAPPKLDQNIQGTLLIEQANSSSDLVTDIDMNSSEISETYQHPPQVIKIGDTYRFLNKGESIHENDSRTPDSVITIVGAEGLQRGSEERPEIHDVKTTTEGADDSLSHILSLVKKKKQPKVKHTISSTTEAVEETTTMEAKAATEEIVAGAILSDTKSDELIDQNPAYPPLPEIFSPNMDDTFDIEAKEAPVKKSTPTISTPADVSDFPNNTAVPDVLLVEELSTQTPMEEFDHIPRNTTTVTRILPEVFGMIDNSSIPENTTNIEMLKINSDTLINLQAALPDDILKQLDNTTEDEANTVQFEDEVTSTVESSDDPRFESAETVVVPRPIRAPESLEDSKIDSGETVIPRNDHESLLSNENASIELKKDEEADDMVGMQERDNDVSLNDNLSKELKFIDSVDEAKKNGSIPKEMDVEIIDTSTLYKSKPVQKITAFPVKIVKRENLKDGADDVITELEKELSDEQTDRTVSSEEEQKESDAIFKDLLEESSTSKVSQNRDSDILGRVTSALTRLTLSGKSDANIIGVLSNLFSSQHNQNK